MQTSGTAHAPLTARAPAPQPARVACASPPWFQLQAESRWATLDFISDLHLHRDDPATAKGWMDYLGRLEFDALFILGDLFEVWVGDDVLEQATDPADAIAPLHPERAFLRACCAALQRCALQRPVYVMQGNRDFLLGRGFHTATATNPLPDPTALHWNGAHWLLSHGDAWCLADTDYMGFREQVRSPAWQQAFLSRPLEEREAIARGLRAQSEARKAASRHEPNAWADVDTSTTLEWLHRTGTTTLLHGHTHRPACHPLPEGRQRLVLSDWDLSVHPPRAEVLRLRQQDCGAPHWQRIPLQGAA